MSLLQEDVTADEDLVAVVRAAVAKPKWRPVIAQPSRWRRVAAWFRVHMVYPFRRMLAR